MSAAYPSVSVKARFSRPPDGPVVERQVTLELRDGGWVYMRGGPTGWESFNPGPGIPGRDWVANLGDGRYDNCVVPRAELRRALRELRAAR